MEQFVYHAFVDVLGKDKVISRDRKAIGMELDVYAPESFAVELGSWNWHKDKVYGADAEKRMKCKEQGIRLVTIYDSVPWDAVVPDECKTYPFDLASEEGHVTLINLTLELISLVLGGRSFDEPDWRTVEQNAAKGSGVRGHEQFVTILRGINPTIRIESQYSNGRTKVACWCGVCERRWKATPQSLLKGHGCPTCSARRTADKQRKTHDVFINEVYKANATVAILGKYKGDSIKIACECKTCGHEWKAIPNSLRKGHGCSKCGLESNVKHLRKSHEKFVSELKEINPTIKVRGKYLSGLTKIECGCEVCGRVWKVTPSSLLQRTGCPDCAKKKQRGYFRKTHEQFVEELRAVNPAVKVIGRYIRTDIKIEILCKTCGHQWMATPSKLLSRRGCPECKRRRLRKNAVAKDGASRENTNSFLETSTTIP